MSAMGAAAQASVPGVYAWAVTVVPVAWARGSTLVSKGAAVLALAALVAGVVGERRWGAPSRLRFASLWGFVLSSALAWSAAPSALGPLRIDAPRGVAGMLGWALFALASAAPALEGRREADRIVEGDEALVPRRRLASGDSAYIVAGAVLAVLMQVLGWRVANAERALLVRFVSLAAGLALIAGAAALAITRHSTRSPRPPIRRVRGALAELVVLAMLAVTGTLFALR
jgi:hypothetical protein